MYLLEEAWAFSRVSLAQGFLHNSDISLSSLSYRYPFSPNLVPIQYQFGFIEDGAFA